jgi:hypothetical protein
MLNRRVLAPFRILVVVCVAALLTTMAACDDSSTAPSPRLDLTGTWSGQLGQPGSTSALTLTWVATQTGDVVSGVATLVKPSFNVQGRGAMTGILNGDRLVLTYAIPPDSIQGFPRCEIAGIGNATATNNAITGTLSLMFTSCAGTGLESPGTNGLMLTR